MGNAKQHSQQKIESLTFGGDLANHAFKHKDAITGSFEAPSLFIDSAGHENDIIYEMAMDGNKYPVLNQDMVLPGNAPPQTVHIRPNGGWQTGQRVTVVQGSATDARSGSLTGSVELD